MIIPVYKINSKKFSLFGLILGSMILDFSYFFNFLPSLGSIDVNNYYSIKTLLFYYMPLSILIYLLYEYIVKMPLIINSSNFIKKRVLHSDIENKEIKSIKTLFVFLYSVITGILTHILLDEFTHPNTFISRNFINLSKRIGIFSISNYLYILTSIIGIIVLLYFFIKIKTKPIPDSYKITTTKKILYWMFVLLCSVIMLIISYQHTNGQLKRLIMLAIKTRDLSIPLGVIRTFVIGFFSGSILGIILTSLIYKVIGLVKTRIYAVPTNKC
jgi:hypothetical protein